jgi:S-adenosylmethionine hydrolase
MALRYDTISFLSDYGHADEFVGVVHSVIRQLCPEAKVIDLTHDIAPFDVRAGGLALARAVQYVTPGVVMAVVDPGVGTARRPVAIEVRDGAAVLLGPDNGLLAPAVQMVGGATRAVWLNDPEHHLDAPGPLFDGRDVFAPVAARLCQGVPLTELGEEIDPASLLPGVFPLSELDGDVLEAEVLWVDRYGNAQLNVSPEELDALGDAFEVRLGDATRTARRATSFAEVGTGSLGLVVDSYGLIALVTDRGAAAEDLGVAAGDRLRLTPVEDGPNAGVTTPVTLSPSPPREEGTAWGATPPSPS